MKLIKSSCEWVWLRMSNWRSEVGQTTAEYALVLLGAAAVAIVLIKWATDNDSIKNFFDEILDKLSKSVE